MLLIQNLSQILANRGRSFKQMRWQIRHGLAFGLWHCNLVKVADRADHFYQRHRAGAIFVDLAKPLLKFGAVEVGIERIHLLAESFKPELRLNHIQIPVPVQIKTIENLP